MGHNVYAALHNPDSGLSWAGNHSLVSTRVFEREYHFASTEGEQSGRHVCPVFQRPSVCDKFKPEGSPG